ncbi:MYB DNA binding protein/ transcription factor-like protein, partial [Thalassiosira pseudonana CCMP1335]
MVEKVRDCRLVAVFTLACLSKLLSTLSIANDSLSDLQQLFATFTNGFLGNRVYDFVEDEEERKHVNVWSDMEKCIFLDRFLHHPKDFRKIASFLKNKTTKDCIQFYYDSKKTIPYKHALKEFLQR